LKILYLTSTSKYDGQVSMLAYTASKGALASMTLPISRELARHAIRVMAIAPGPFSSAMAAGMTEKVKRSFYDTGGIVYPKRFGQPEEFAKTVRWVVEVPYVNGEVVRLSAAGRLSGKL
jgi:NAD(P)-dependent dehydrogenase (short-subunit alcohol dehydrogenase family)